MRLDVFACIYTYLWCGVAGLQIPVGEQKCDLLATSQYSTRQRYCYKCTGDLSHVERRCFDLACHEDRFKFTVGGITTYYWCNDGCRGEPLACLAKRPFGHGYWSCSSDIEKPSSPSPRKFLACQTCWAQCNQGYELKQEVSVSCGQRNSTHMEWNGPDTTPQCINMDELCRNPNIPGVNLTDCVTNRDLHPTTSQFVYRRECKSQCSPGLYKVTSVSTACGEDGQWSNRDRLTTLCVDPSSGCELPDKSPGSSWFCTGVQFNTSHVASGATCRLDCSEVGELGSNNSLTCDNSRWIRSFSNLPEPFCFDPKNSSDIKTQSYLGLGLNSIPIITVLALVGVCCRGIWNKKMNHQRKVIKRPSTGSLSTPSTSDTSMVSNADASSHASDVGMELESADSSSQPRQHHNNDASQTTVLGPADHHSSPQAWSDPEPEYSGAGSLSTPSTSDTSMVSNADASSHASDVGMELESADSSSQPRQHHNNDASQTTVLGPADHHSSPQAWSDPEPEYSGADCIPREQRTLKPIGMDDNSLLDTLLDQELLKSGELEDLKLSDSSNSTVLHGLGEVYADRSVAEGQSSSLH